MLPVTVVIPCYNAAHTLARALDSCIAQPEAAQILVADDASIDTSSDVVRHYAQHDARIELLPMPSNGGAARARNWAAQHARHPLLAFLDADDEYLPGALAAASGFLNAQPRQASVRLDVEFADFPPQISAHPLFASLGAQLSNTVPSSLVIRREAFAALGGFPPDDFFRRHGGEDGPLALALRSAFGNPRLADAKRVRMHYHPGIHAERYFRISMGMQALPAQLFEQMAALSQQCAARAVAGVAALREFDAAPCHPPVTPTQNPRCQAST
jgi:glycosyltransferase involved in cell wall biosynthesis